MIWICVSAFAIVAMFASYFLLVRLLDRSSQPMDLMQRTSSVPRGLHAGEVRVFDGLEFVWCPPGEIEFGSSIASEEICAKIGCDPNNPEQFAGEYPPKHGPMDRGFWLSRSEVTRKEWTDILGTEPWGTQLSGLDIAKVPVTNVSRVMIEDYLKQKIRKTKRLYGLPNEAMWEYACKAGTISIFSSGDDIERLGDYAWFGEPYDSTDVRPIHEVGQKLPNNWGLFDMHGNVWEFCSDGYDSKGDLLPEDVPVVEYAVVPIRGGGASTHPSYLRSAQRIYCPPNVQESDTGFRLALWADQDLQ